MTEGRGNLGNNPLTPFVKGESVDNPLPPLLKGNKSVSVLIQSVQTDPLTDKIVHIDFHQVKETEMVTTEIELKFVGESRVVKEQGGILIKNLNSLLRYKQ